LIIKCTKTQWQVIVGAMIDRKKNANPPLNAFGNRLHDDMLNAYIHDENIVDLRESD